MSNSNPRDIQVLQIATNTTVLRARSWTRLRFEIEYALARGTTINSYLIEGDQTAIIDPPPETFTAIYPEALQQCLDLKRLDYVILGHFSPSRLATLKVLLETCSADNFCLFSSGGGKFACCFP